MIDKLFTRDNLIWNLTLVASVVTYALGHTHLIPPSHAGQVQDVATLCGFVSAYLGNSPLPHSSSL